MIELNNVSFSYSKSPFISELNLTIQSGNFTCLIGENGAGKTTLLQLIAGLLSPKNGEVRIDSQDYRNDESILRNKVFATINEPKFYNHLTAYQNLEVFCIYKSISANKISEVLELLKISENKRISELSSGMKQKLTLAFPLLYNYEVIILDEPLANLDIFSIELVLNLFAKLDKVKNIIISTHILSEFGEFFNEYILIKNGKVILQEYKDDTFIEYKKKLIVRYHNS